LAAGAVVGCGYFVRCLMCSKFGTFRVLDLFLNADPRRYGEIIRAAVLKFVEISFKFEM
jgi:hypothetical protein